MTSPNISVTITGASVSDVQTALLALAKSLGGEAIEHVAVSTDGTEAKVDVKRTKTKGKATPANDAAPASDEPADAPVEAPAPDNSVKEKSAVEARDEAIKQVQAYFSENPGAMPSIKQLTEKYGVTYFKDVSDEHAFDFLADVKLLVAGAGQAA